jgi:hypothetical protein
MKMAGIKAKNPTTRFYSGANLLVFSSNYWPAPAVSAFSGCP